MTDISRVRITLDGFAGGPGVMTFYVADVAACMEGFTTWIDHMLAYQPPNIHAHLLGVGDIINDASGDLVGTWTSVDTHDGHGVGDTTYAAPLGLCVTWLTGGVVDGHGVKGRTYIVPICTSIISTDGGIQETARAGIEGFSQSLIDDLVSNLYVWHRPRKASVKHPTARAGQAVLATTAKVSSKTAILTSRRD